MTDHGDKRFMGAAFEVPIERGKVREFASAVRAASREYYDQPAAPTPPTFLTTAMWWVNPDDADSDAWAEVGLDPTLSVHGEQEYVFHGPPPRAGDVLSARTHLESVYEKPGKRGGVMRFVVTVTEFRDHAGKLVAEERGTAIQLEHATGGDQ